MQAAAPEEIWGPVEEGLLPAVTVTLHTWMDAPSKSLPQVKDFNICVAGGESLVYFLHEVMLGNFQCWSIDLGKFLSFLLSVLSHAHLHIHFRASYADLQCCTLL